jgi:hypothetical protein
VIDEIRRRDADIDEDQALGQVKLWRAATIVAIDLATAVAVRDLARVERALVHLRRCGVALRLLQGNIREDSEQMRALEAELMTMAEVGSGG